MTNNNDIIQEISLELVRPDKEMQVRCLVSEETIQRYHDVMENEEGRNLFPPILLFLDDDDKYWLADGHHRVLAAIRRKFTSIRAIVRRGSKAEAIWEAAKANGRNGLPLAKVDIRRAVEMVLAVFPERSNAVIADAIGCSHQYICKIRDQVATSCNLNETKKRVGKDGKSYPAQKTEKRNPKSATGAGAEESAKSEKPTKRKPVETPKPEKQLPVEATMVESQNPAQEEQVTPIDNSNTEKTNAVESQIMAMLTELESLVGKWFDFAPTEQHEAFISRCRKRIAEIFG